MASLREFRAQNPEYNDMSDGDLARALHRRYYSDMDQGEFMGQLGLTPDGFDPSRPNREHPDYHRSLFSPFEIDGETRTVSPAVPGVFGLPRQLARGIYESGRRVVETPRQVMSGELPIYMEDGSFNPEVIGRSLETAVWATPTPPPMRSGGGVAASARPTPVRATRRIETPVQAAARRQDVAMPVAAATERRTVRDIGTRISDVPVVGEPIRRSAQGAIDDMGAALQRSIDDLGSGSANRAGTRLSDDIAAHAGRSASGSIGAREAALYQRVDELVDEAILTPLEATRRAAARIAQRRSAAALDDIPSQGLQRVQNALQRDGLSYQGIKDLRTFFREAQSSPVQLQSIGMNASQANQIYRALTEDLRTAVMRSGGERAVQAFNRANQFAQVAARERRMLDRILGKDGTRSPENIVTRLRNMAGQTSTADIQQLHRARRAVSRETWDDFASSVLAELGRDGQGGFSGARFVTNWGKLSPQGRSALFQNAGTRQAIDDLVLLSERFNELNRLRNYSQSGSLLSGVAAVTGLALDPLTTLGVLLPANGLARILARPSQARVVRLWAQAYSDAVMQPTTRATQMLADRAAALGVILARETGAPNAVMNLTSSLKNIPTRAEDEQQPQRIEAQDSER